MAGAPGYTASAYLPRRRATRELRVGDVWLGAVHPIRIQSMTTTDTLDTRATADQTERLVAAGCEIVRITAPSLREAENLREIQTELRRRGLRVPLVADIHYTPNAAMIAAEHVEKVRVNPGNYADRKRFELREYSDAQYREEVERAAERFRPLVRRLKQLGRALRIGTNHGSLADRVMNRYGDTPLGMVESALEFLEVCENEGYYDVVFSMKASNPQVAVHAYRLLAARLAARREPPGGGYPFHVGVTEAGDGEDGRIKSAIGIGALLEDGLGDTIRVSLTEDPVKEIPVARALARLCEERWESAARLPPPACGDLPYVADAYAHRRRDTRSLGDGARGPVSGGSHPVRVELELGPTPVAAGPVAEALARELAEHPELVLEGLLVDVPDTDAAALLPSLAHALREAGVAAPLHVRAEGRFALDCVPHAARLVAAVGVLVRDETLLELARAAAAAGIPMEWSLRGRLAEVPRLAQRALSVSAAAGLEDFALSPDVDAHPVHAARLVAALLLQHSAADVPVVLRHRRLPTDDAETALLRAALDLGAPLCDGIGDAVSVSGWQDAGAELALAYRILQGARLRSSWTEYISCPSCGRTLFDLEETTARIKARTSHLRGVKIAVMGCIVNGPGEMADADFGYVGSGPGLVDLFVGHERVERKVPQAEADERLVELIREHGRWQDPRDEASDRASAAAR